MAERAVSLIVHLPGNCPLIKSGDAWMVNGLELSKSPGTRLCGAGICSVYPKLKDILKVMPPNGVLPDDYLLCDTQGCDAVFRMEFIAKNEPGVIGATQRIERGASAATMMLKNSAPFLRRISKEVADDVIQACTNNAFEDKQVILAQGVAGQHLYIVGEGKVQVVRHGDGADETILVTLGEGECFGEMSILTGELTSAEVRSHDKSMVLTVHKEKLEALLMKWPELSRIFSRLLADRLKATNVSLQSELSRGILGKLSMISLVDLVQTLNQSRRTGTLVLNYTGTPARIGFRNGQVVTAVAGTVEGDEAFYKVICWPDGDFCFEQIDPTDTDPGAVESDLMGLMMEGMRRLDEAKQVAR